MDATKPSASRHASAEIFLVCQNYKAPAQIDPRLLDARHVLQEYTTAVRMHGPVVMQKKQSKKMHRKFREGYEEGASTTFKSTSIVTFIQSADPVETLGLYTQFKFEPIETSDTAMEEEKRKEMEKVFQTVMQHPKTTDEIRESCQDLLVLGKKEFKKLLKWCATLPNIKRRCRLRYRRLSIVKHVEAQKPSKVVQETEEAVVDPEERMMREMAAIQERIEHKAKKRAKKQREMKKHAKKRLAQFNQTEGIEADAVADPDLFSLDMFQKETEIEQQRRLSADPEGLEVDYGRSEERASDTETEEDDDELKHELLLEDYLENAYQRFLKREVASANLEAGEIKRRKRLDEKGELSEEEDREMEWTEASDDDDGSEMDVTAKTPGGGLLVKLDSDRAGVATTPDAITAQWFSQKLFQDADLMEEEAPNDISVSAKAASRGEADAEMVEEVMSEVSDYKELKEQATVDVKADADASDFEVVGNEASSQMKEEDRGDTFGSLS